MTLASPDIAAPGRRTSGALDTRADTRNGRLPADAGRRAWQEEALAVLCLLAVLATDLALIRVGLDGIDEGYFVEQAARVVRGDLPYRDFDTLYTPGLLYLHAFFFNLIGDTHVLVPRAVGLVMRALLAGGLYLVCRPLVRPMFAALPGLYVLLGLDRVPLTWEPHPGWPSAALTVLAVLAFAHLPRLGNRQRIACLIALGALAGVVFALKQNAGVFLGMALVAFTAWRGIDDRQTTVTRALRVTQWLVLMAVVLAAALLIRPSGSRVAAIYLLVPLVAAGVAALWPVSVAPDGRRLVTWLQVLVLLGLGFGFLTLPWLVALVVALDGRLDLLRGFVGAVDHALLWYGLRGPKGGAWASLLGMAVAALLAIRHRRQPRLLLAAVAAFVVFAVSAVLLTAEPGESWRVAVLLTAGRAALGLPVWLPFVCILAGAWLSFRGPPIRATWQLRWLTVASALTFLTQYPRTDEVHLAWSAGLPLATGAVALGHLHATLAGHWSLGRMGRLALAAVLVAVPLATILPGLYDRSQGFVDARIAGRFVPHVRALVLETSLPGLQGLIVTHDQASTLLATIRFVQANTAPGEPIFVYPSTPLVYVAADRPNPTRFAHLYPGAASEAELEHVITALAQTPVRVVVASGAELAFWGPPAGNQPLEAFLVEHYREVARFGGYRVLMLR